MLGLKTYFIGYIQYTVGETRTLTMRDYFLINTNGIKTKVAYSYGCPKQSGGEAKINMSHLSLRFNVAENV
ncbi:hypothetical protein [uncultured Aquimarina sp.]|uniref:hypothetical protein n=1 Tax=uncultured Aquimarina sp. TaxID=575652 RepID=UPI002625D782|nr:hypothetical protein [uncultured Aquimarina sp.]